MFNICACCGKPTVTPKLTLVPDDADLMTIGEFIEDCKRGVFTDYDGSGYYVVDGYESDIPVDCGLLREGIVNQAMPWTHVAWYNK